MQHCSVQLSKYHVTPTAGVFADVVTLLEKRT